MKDRIRQISPVRFSRLIFACIAGAEELVERPALGKPELAPARIEPARETRIAAEKSA